MQLLTRTVEVRIESDYYHGLQIEAAMAGVTLAGHVRALMRLGSLIVGSQYFFTKARGEPAAPLPASAPRWTSVSETERAWLAAISPHLRESLLSSIAKFERLNPELFVNPSPPIARVKRTVCGAASL
jgi:hypothetical protein